MLMLLHNWWMWSGKQAIIENVKYNSFTKVLFNVDTRIRQGNFNVRTYELEISI